jgi:hypothetical protein
MIVPADVPDWCRVRRGTSALLLVAPHGGARLGARPARGTVKVNDLHTATLADELATALDAGLVANPTLDRNVLDLNRISQVARAAAWFPALLEDLIDEILARHERAEILFLHGWNTLQAKCDIGIGHFLRDAGDADTHAAALTASPAFITTRLAALRAACAARGIATPLGERYPARHANNVLQLFRRHGVVGGLAPRLTAWAAAGRVDAVQLELAAPLRWPGPLRGAFGAALRVAFTPTDGTPCADQPAIIARRQSPTLAAPAGLRVYDPACGIGLLARVDAAGDSGRVAGRLLLFLGGANVALFTGDDSAHAGCLSGGGPHFTSHPDGLHLAFDGWALRTDDGGLYVDLEQALAASHLLAVRADLVFARVRGDCGRVRGTLSLDGVDHAIDAPGFAPPGGPAQSAAGGWRSQLSLDAVLSGGAAVYVRHRVPGAAVIEDCAATQRIAHPLASMAVHFDADPHTPRRIVLDDAGGGLVAEAIAHMAIVRPLIGGRRARVTLGIARVARAGVAGFGFCEYARVVD